MTPEKELQGNAVHGRAEIPGAPPAHTNSTNIGPISTHDLPRLFEPFFRSKTVRSQGIPGLGLGLSVVERIARVFGATVTVHSELDAGSRFEIRLPLAGTSLPANPSTGPAA